MDTEKAHIVIRGAGAISPLGHDAVSTAACYRAAKPGFVTIQHQNTPTPVAKLPEAAEQKLQELLEANPNYKQLDRSVLMAIYAARQATEQAGWLQEEEETLQHGLAVNIGSSRGASGLFEHHYDAFLQQALSSGASPTTTLGNLSSWVAHAVNAGGAQISHSITCSTALMAIANAAAWLKAGMAQRFLAGGTEAPLTDFTIAQMKAIGIYSKLHDSLYPCQPYTLNKQNTFVLGEGAAVFALEQVNASRLKKGDYIVEAIGFGFEKIQSKTGISSEGLNFQQSMQHALQQLPKAATIDLIITHTPGTRAGDSAELAAIEKVFGAKVPFLTNNKWLIGHTLGASGALSLAYALHIFQQQRVSSIPYSIAVSQQEPASVKSVKRILINAAGFGGNAASLVLTLI
ncbi:beta-ketoacyl synthase N-terminal-like domain-containing protein [Pontibacter harenae]|uniref:beta-ketoacyl synthase N-terminal-like domain-containing protein n=1 Tax=Pontibacter harenae TaxID=2894083 RepID=UPI001E62126C|nr:beta-ketoacyl synthase N-terminal-like domain-containing protein [Pontibacter harenae]MCC9166322.1 beta-ketoacyl-ACP reductase [Pontibacter harenae]